MQQSSAILRTEIRTDIISYQIGGGQAGEFPEFSRLR